MSNKGQVARTAPYLLLLSVLFVMAYYPMYNQSMAYFEATTTRAMLTVQVNPAGAGTVSLNPSQPDGGYMVGTVVTVSETQSGNVPFGGWSCSGSISCSGLSPTIQVTMNGPGTVTANFGSSISFDFRLYNSGNSSNLGGVTVARGSSGSVTIIAVLVNGPAQSVTLSCNLANGSPLPSGVSCSSASGIPPFTRTPTVTVSSSTAPGYYSVEVVGTAGSLTRVTVFTLSVV